MTWQDNRAQALEANKPFFDAIYRGLRGQLAIVTRDEYGALNSERWFPVEQIESARQYAAARWDEDVYFSVSTFTKESRVSSTESLTNVVYADADTCHPSKFRLEPSIVVETSAGRWHCLWLLSEPVAGQVAGELSAKVSVAHAADGCDKHAKDTKILRVPGTTNTKYQKPFTVVAEYSDKRYSFGEFAEAYSDVELHTVTQVSSTDLDLAVYTAAQRDQLSVYADAVWSNALKELENEANLGWSGTGWDNTAYKVSCKLLRVANAPWTNYSLVDVETALEDCPLNDPSFRAASKLDQAVKAVGSDALMLPDWAVEFQNVELPDLDGVDLPALEEKLDRAGLTQWYVSVPQEGDANQFALDFLDRCRSLGFSELETLAVVSNSNVFQNKASLTLPFLWVALNRQIDAEVEIPDLPLARRDWQDIPALLSDDEREWCLANPVYPDEHVAWVKSTGTDAATVYQRTLAFVILSSVYGDVGFLRDVHGDTRLSIYATILGDSTSTRKTTAMNRAMTVLHEYEERTGKDIDLTSDATKESLAKALAERDGQVSVMHVDEFQGYLEEIAQKRYQAGFLGALAKLYDGNVEASLRVSKDSGNKKAKVTFNFVGVGIRKHVATMLTTKNYESGLMPRFVWAVADPPPFSEDAMSLPEEPPTRGDEYGKYGTLVNLINKFIVNRRKLGEDRFQPVVFTAPAISLYNRAGRVATRYLHASGQHEYLDAAKERWGMNVRKAAALLALHDGELEVSARHMLHALRQGELWFRDMVRMANEVASTDFERQVDEVEKYILDSSKNRRQYSDVRNRFKGMKAQEFQECLTNLTSRGRVRYDSRTGTITAFVV